MRRNALVNLYPSCFLKIQKIAKDLVPIIQTLLTRCDEEDYFEDEIVKTLSESIGVMLNYWDCFENDYSKENVPVISRDIVNASVEDLAGDLDLLEADTESFIGDHSKRQLNCIHEWILDIIRLLE